MSLGTILIAIGLASTLFTLCWGIYELTHADTCDMHIELDEQGREWVVCTIEHYKSGQRGKHR